MTPARRQHCGAVKAYLPVPSSSQKTEVLAMATEYNEKLSDSSTTIVMKNSNIHIRAASGSHQHYSSKAKGGVFIIHWTLQNWKTSGHTKKMVVVVTNIINACLVLGLGFTIGRKHANVITIRTGWFDWHDPPLRWKWPRLRTAARRAVMFICSNLHLYIVKDSTIVPYEPIFLGDGKLWKLRYQKHFIWRVLSSMLKSILDVILTSEVLMVYGVSCAFFVFLA